MKARVVAGLLFAIVFSVAHAVEISAEQWSRPRRAETVVRLPGLAELITTLDRQPHGRVVVHHASGDAAQLWAEELRGWLIALGVGGDQVVLRADLAARDRVRLEVIAQQGSP